MKIKKRKTKNAGDFWFKLSGFTTKKYSNVSIYKSFNYYITNCMLFLKMQKYTQTYKVDFRKNYKM